MKKNFLRTFLVLWGFLMMQTTVFAIEHVYPEINFYAWNSSRNSWNTISYSSGATANYIYTILAYDFRTTITLENGDDINIFCYINDEDPTTVSLNAAVIVLAKNENMVGTYTTSSLSSGAFKSMYLSPELDESLQPLESNWIGKRYDKDYLNSRLLTDQNVNFQTITIPETVTDEAGNHYTVTKIGDYAFGIVSFKNISSVVLPGTIKEIGKGAFYGQESLTSINISDCKQLEKICMRALSNCINLQSVDFTGCNSLREIEVSAFKDTPLREVNLLYNKNLKFIGRTSFANTNLEKVYLPETTTTMGYDSFASDNLKEVYITSKISFFCEDSEYIIKRYGANFGGTNNNAAIYVPLKYMDYYRTKHSSTELADENGFFDNDDDIAKLYPILESGKLYRTFSYDKPVNLDAIEGLYNPSNTLKANIVTAIDVPNRRVTFTEKTGDVAPLEGIIIEGTGEAGEFYPIKKYTGTTEPAALGDTENYLEGNGAETLSFEDKKPAGGKQRYFIMKGGDFYYCTGGTLAKWKCYLDVREPISVYGSVSQDAKFFSIFSEDDAMPTTIKGVSDVNTDGDAYYTLDGIRVSGQPQKKGIYVHNGRKVVVR